MSLSIDEQEISIGAMRDEDFATAYCSDTTWITKMDKLVNKSPGLFTVIAETEHGKTYKFPKRLLSIRSCLVERKISEEQRQRMAERMRSFRRSQSLNDGSVK